jgi:outer membrane lipoprotein SlyB
MVHQASLPGCAAYLRTKEIPMRTSSRFALIASSAAVAAVMAGCSTTRTVSLNVPVPATTVAAAPAVVVPEAAPVAAVEFGHVTNIEYFPGGTATSRINVPGAVVGGVTGAVIGNQVGRAVGGRDAATVLGCAAGAAIGSQAGAATSATSAAYRVTIQTDTGAFRTYDVPATGDLRIGDRVRVENGVIYRS